MNPFNRRPKEDLLRDPICRLLTELDRVETGSERYKAISEDLERLYKLRAETQRKLKVSPDTLCKAGAGLAQVLVIVLYEHSHVLTSKGLPFVVKNND